MCVYRFNVSKLIFREPAFDAGAEVIGLVTLPINLRHLQPLVIAELLAHEAVKLKRVFKA